MALIHETWKKNKCATDQKQEIHVPFIDFESRIFRFSGDCEVSWSLEGGIGGDVISALRAGNDRECLCVEGGIIEDFIPPNGDEAAIGLSWPSWTEFSSMAIPCKLLKGVSRTPALRK